MSTSPARSTARSTGPGVRTCRYPDCGRPAQSRVNRFCSDPRHSNEQEREGRIAQKALASSITESLARSGKWTQWQEIEPRLAFDSLEDACAGWRRRRDRDCYQTLAALARLGSRRGGNDDDAALALIVLLSDGVDRIARRLSDLNCEISDVHAMLWQVIKEAEPHLGNRAGFYLLERTHQQLCRPAAGLVSRVRSTSLEAYVGSTRPDRDMILAAPIVLDMASITSHLAYEPVEDPVEDLTDILTWARDEGAIAPEEIALLIELMATEYEVMARNETRQAREEAQRIVGARHGVSMRQVRRRRDQTTARLREVAPRYLAATA